VDMKLDDNFKITLWYFKMHKYNEFVQRSSILTKVMCICKQINKIVSVVVRRILRMKIVTVMCTTL